MSAPFRGCHDLVELSRQDRDVVLWEDESSLANHARNVARVARNYRTPCSHRLEQYAAELFDELWSSTRRQHEARMGCVKLGEPVLINSAEKVHARADAEYIRLLAELGTQWTVARECEARTVCAGRECSKESIYPLLMRKCADIQHGPGRHIVRVLSGARRSELLK